MAIIQVNEEWRIRGGEHSWNVERRVWRTDKKTGERLLEWGAVTYHAGPGQAAISLARRRIRTAEVEGIGAIMDEWERITAEIDRALEAWKPAA